MSKLSNCALLPTIVAVLLAGCGGGGGSPGLPGPSPAPQPAPVPPPTLNSVDVAAAWHNFLTTPMSWTMPGKEATGRAFEITVETRPGPGTIFSMTGVSSQTLAETLRLSLTGANTVSSNDTLFFNNDTIVGFAVDNGGCEVPRAIAVLPHASPVGASGAFFTVDGFAGCTLQGQKLGSTIRSWSIQVDSNILMFCMGAQEESAAGFPIGSNLHCIEASANGTLGARAKFSMSMPDGSTLNGRNF
jgi:hypothetical protein